MKKLLFISLLLLQPFILSKSYACRCAETTAEELLDNADHVFIAYITSSTVNTETNSIDFKFDITEKLKGEPSKINFLTTGFHSCRLTLNIATKYLVLLRGDGNHISQCSGTRRINNMYTPEEEQEYVDILKGYINDRKPITRQNSQHFIKQYHIEKCRKDTHPLNIEYTKDFYKDVEQ